MKVALLGPIAWRTPPRAYGPWEQIVSLLAEGLVARGVDVTLFASLDSVTAATLDGVCARPYNEDPTWTGASGRRCTPRTASERSGEFDLVHNNLDWLPLAMSRALPGAACSRPSTASATGGSCPLTSGRRSAFVSISDADRAPNWTTLATVHHGIDVSAWPFERRRAERWSRSAASIRTRRTADAIEIARAAGRPLIICGPVQDEAYFAEQVAPHIDGDTVRYLGNVGGDRAGPGARPCGGAAAPAGLRRAVRPLRGRGDGLRHAGGRLPTRRDARDGRARASPASWSTTSPARWPRSRPRWRWTVPEWPRSAASRFSADRMVDEYIAVYERLLATT